MAFIVIDYYYHPLFKKQQHIKQCVIYNDSRVEETDVCFFAIEVYKTFKSKLNSRQIPN